MVNVAVPMFPWASVALQVTVVCPIANVDPDAGLHGAVSGPSMLSVAVAFGYVTATPPGLVASARWFGGGVTTGFVVSCTVTLNDFVAELACESVAVQVTVVVPKPKLDP